MPVMTTAVAVWRRLVVRDAPSGDGYLLDLQDRSRQQSDRRPYTVRPLREMFRVHLPAYLATAG